MRNRLIMTSLPLAPFLWHVVCVLVPCLVERKRGKFSRNFNFASGLLRPLLESSLSSCIVKLISLSCAQSSVAYHKISLSKISVTLLEPVLSRLVRSLVRFAPTFPCLFCLARLNVSWGTLKSIQPFLLFDRRAAQGAIYRYGTK